MTQAHKVLAFVAHASVLRVGDLTTQGVTRATLGRLCRDGRLRRIGRGLYVSSRDEPTENRSLVEAAQRVPSGVICLLSALRFHGLTTQLPSEIWLAIDRKARRPREPRMALHIVRFSGRALREGIQPAQIEGVAVRIYNPAKTVADCFKYRHKIGRDIALEALRDCLRLKKATVDELWRFAEICRVAKVMTPYLEAVT